MNIKQSTLAIAGFVDSVRVNRLIRLMTTFLAGQGSIQVLNLMSGFLLLRWLSVEAYAQYSVAFGFQSTLGMLVDLGFSGSIIALVGDRISDKTVISSYVAAARYFRNWLSIVLFPVGVLVFPLITAKHGWDWTTQLFLLGSIISSLFFQGWTSFYSPPLLMHGQLREFYQPQILSSGLRLLLCFSLYIMSALTSWASAWVNSVVLLINGFSYKRLAKSWVVDDLASDRQTRKEMSSYLSPLIPGIIFTAFQGQISLFLITWFGKSESVAEVAALGRVGQLFLLLAAFNGIVVAPYIAKVPVASLLKRYLQILGLASLVGIVLSAIAFYFPAPLLWIMGAKYQHLHTELGWTILVACIGYIGGVMWTMHSARKWVYWWGTWFYIGILLLTQSICLFTIDLSSVLNVIYFSLASTLSVMLVHVTNAIYGFWKGPRKSLQA